jgi:hypothetical protein
MDELLLALDPKAVKTPTAAPAVPADANEKVLTATAPTAPTSQPVSPPVPATPRKNTWVWLSAACAVACLVATPLFLGQKGGAQTAYERESRAREAQASATGGPILGLCAADVKSDCKADTTAWCDTSRHVVGCCGKGLVATGADGICDCPPGGDLPDAAVATCPVAQVSGIPHADDVITTLRPKFRACYNASLTTKPELVGRMTVRLVIAPDGRVFNAHFIEGRIADKAVMTCVLDVVRGARFEPAPGGTADLDIPVGFVSQSSDATAPMGAEPPRVASEPLGMPGRHPCRAKGGCGAGITAWCDADEKQLACCDPGFVAVGHDGMCECPPGGMTKPTGSCQKARLTEAEWKKVVDAMPDGLGGSSLHECLKATDAGLAWGSTQVERVLDPDGRVATLRITHSSLPGVHAQGCVLDALRGFKAPPPPDGIHWDTVGVELSRPSSQKGP